jgi:hypothetical protein
VEEGNPEWVGEWIWLSLAKIGSQKFKNLFSSPTVRYLHLRLLPPIRTNSPCS